ncbi:hypothetical protein PFBG_01031 [Plasmodium falciparum 7G8]|uniref:Uncharacterized protein n=1 Tax=Plasmodium falciparum (isolate 7G8) TaxID=57266 RepID=W7F6C9_PLAF8|nr:hypothetical protein PFBG_01031 [Plasmodium falciparum 7G8]
MVTTPVDKDTSIKSLNEKGYILILDSIYVPFCLINMIKDSRDSMSDVISNDCNNSNIMIKL